MRQQIKKNRNIWNYIVIGIVISMLLSLVGAVMIASAMNGGHISERTADLFAAIVLGLSTALGIILVGSKIKENFLVAASLISVGFLMILITIKLIFFGLPLVGIARGVVAPAAGFLLANLLNYVKKPSKNRKVRYRRK